LGTPLRAFFPKDFHVIFSFSHTVSLFPKPQKVQAKRLLCFFPRSGKKCRPALLFPLSKEFFPSSSAWKEATLKAGAPDTLTRKSSAASSCFYSNSSVRRVSPRLFPPFLKLIMTHTVGTFTPGPPSALCHNHPFKSPGMAR